MTPAKRETFFARLAKQRPHPESELYYINAYTLLVAVVLSAQMTDSGVNKVTKKLFQTIKTPQDLVEKGEDFLREALKTINLYKTKARHVYALSQKLIAQHNGEVPQDRAALESLAGVGRKTANVVLNVAFGQPTMAVDTHVFRVANRTGLARGKTPLDVEKKLLKQVPAKWANKAHHWLILHGRYTCKARKPLCFDCVISDLCSFKEKTQKEEKEASPKTQKK